MVGFSTPTIKVIDTPGYNDNKGRELRVFSEMQNALSEGANIVLYLIDGTATRQNIEDSKCLDNIKDLLGVTTLDNIYIFLTQFDRLSEELSNTNIRNWSGNDCI